VSGADGEAATGPRRGGAHVKVTDVRRVHQDSIVALDGISLTLEPGDFTALTGPSGSGKTSLLSLIGALDRPTSGSVEVNGELISDGGDHSRYRRDMVGFVFQHHYLLPDLTAQANVELPQIASERGRRERAERARELLGEVGVQHRLDVLARHLSGGERQRVAVARALANDPLLLLADEPTGALDSEAARRVLDLIEAVRERRGMTLLVVTYDREVAERADTVLHLFDGRLAEGGSSTTLRPGKQLDP
jgi:putative ABC transport system ATP-binding protein